MNRKEIRVCMLRVGGTNCDAETKRSFEALGAKARIVHLNKLVEKENLEDYDILVFPGGFSYGDYVRAGAIWAKMIVTKLGKQLKAFAEEDRLILGICNGFQVLIEAGLLPGFNTLTKYPEAALATNVPPGYNCRWIHIRHDNKGKCRFTQGIHEGKILYMPVAHAEGRFLFPKEEEEKLFGKLREQDQLVFRYCKENGEYANNHFPTNPNGSFQDIAGVCNPEGNVLGLMPHPERAFYWWQQPNWTRSKPCVAPADGKMFFQSIIQNLKTS
jgi:phosphoribosylformylglycinamidine synthase I